MSLIMSTVVLSGNNDDEVTIIIPTIAEILATMIIMIKIIAITQPKGKDNNQRQKRK